MTNKIATEQYLINLAGGGTNTPINQAYIGGDTANISINVII